MQNRPVVLEVSLTFIVAMLVTSAFSRVAPNVASLSSTLGRGGEAIDRADVEFKRAIVAAREAEAAGADGDQLKVLVERLNTVLWMVDRAEQLLIRGDVEGAVAEAERS